MQFAIAIGYYLHPGFHAARKSNQNADGTTASGSGWGI